MSFVYIFGGGKGMESILNSLLRQPPFEFASRRRKFRLAHGPLILTFGDAPTRDDDLRSRVKSVYCANTVYLSL